MMTCLAERCGAFAAHANECAMHAASIHSSGPGTLDLRDRVGGEGQWPAKRTRVLEGGQGR